MNEITTMPVPTATERRLGPVSRPGESVGRKWSEIDVEMWYASGVTARVMRGNEALRILPEPSATTNAIELRYSRAVYARFAVFASSLFIALVLGAVSYLPGGRELALGALLAGLVAAIAGASGAERAQFERLGRDQ